MKVFFCTLLFVLATLPVFCQVIPPGLERSNVASWFALGIQQDLDTTKGRGWQSVSYIGAGRISNPDNHNPFYKPGIFVLNQEFKNRFRKNWEYSLAASYRRQHEYDNVPPYGKSDPALKQEFRLYGRLSYIIRTSFVEITPTLRQEIQKYFTPDFQNYPESLKLRSRFRLKFSFPLTEDNSHKIILFSEQLFSVSREIHPSVWTTFGYKDSRFALYYSFSPDKAPFTFNLGYMNDLINSTSPVSVSYFGLDVIWKNPFSPKR